MLMRPSLFYLTDSDKAGKPAIAAGIAKNGKRSSPDRPTAPLRMGNHYPECGACQPVRQAADAPKLHTPRSEEHTSELQSLMRISYAVFCLKKKQKIRHYEQSTSTTQTTQSNLHTDNHKP